MIGGLAPLPRLCGKHLFIGIRMIKERNGTMDYDRLSFGDEGFLDISRAAQPEQG
jgi:hypothetical protein